MKLVYLGLGVLLLNLSAAHGGAEDYKPHPYYPFIRADGTVAVFSEPRVGDPTIGNCDVHTVGTKYVGTQPICAQDAWCDYRTCHFNCLDGFGRQEFHFYCVTPSAQAGCSRSPWQNCAVDPSTDDMNPNKCLTDQPGPLPAGCPDLSKKPQPALKAQGQGAVR